MDYAKSGGASTAKHGPRPKRGALKGAPKPEAPDKAAAGKAELLARMKAAAKTPKA